MVRALSILVTAGCLAIVPRMALSADLPLSPPIACANGLIGGIKAKRLGQSPAALYPARDKYWVGLTGEGLHTYGAG